jgi:hypothetical protein
LLDFAEFHTGASSNDRDACAVACSDLIL